MKPAKAILIGLTGVLLLMVAITLSKDWRQRTVALAVGPNGATLRVIQDFHFGGEMFYTSVIYSNAANVKRFYFHHQDHLWRARDTRIVTQENQAQILRQGKAVIRFDWSQQIYYNLRNGTTNPVLSIP